MIFQSENVFQIQNPSSAVADRLEPPLDEEVRAFSLADKNKIQSHNCGGPPGAF